MKISERTKQLFTYLMFIIGLMFLVVSLLMLMSIVRLDMNGLLWLSCFFTIYFILFAVFNGKVAPFSVSMMVVYYMFFQGFGLIIAYVINREFVIGYINRTKYFYGEYLSEYLALSVLSLMCIILGIVLFKNDRKRQQVVSKQLSTSKRKDYYYEIGIMLLLFFTLFLSFNLLQGNIPIGNYDEYKRWLYSSSLMNYAQIGYWISSVFICASGSKKQILFALVIFTIPSSILLLTGNRNDVFIPLLIGLGLYVTRFKQVPKLLLVVSILLVFVISPQIIELRGGQAYGKDMIDTFTNRLARSFAELGSQLAAVSHMFSWLDKGEDYAYGLTYIYGIIGLFLGRLAPDIREAIRTSRYWIQPRVPTLAFAMSAEVYFNFGIIGIIIVYIIIGYYFARSEQKYRDLDSKVNYGFIGLYLLFLVRNTFGYSFIYVLVYLIIYCAEKFIRNIFKRKKLAY